MSRFSSLAAGLALALIIVPSVSAQPLRIIVTRPNVIIVEPSLDPPPSRSPVRWWASTST